MPALQSALQTTLATDPTQCEDSFNFSVSTRDASALGARQHQYCALASSRSYNEFTLLEQRWLDECFDLFTLDVGEDKTVAQDTILFLAKHIEWFNYAVSQSGWCKFPALRPATAEDFHCETCREDDGSFDEPLTDFRERMARLSNRHRSIVRVHPPILGQEIHHTTCAWFETVDLGKVNKSNYFALRAKFDRGEFETEMSDFQSYLVEASLVTQTNAWDLSDASDILDRILSKHNDSRIAPSQSDGSHTLKCLIIDTIRKSSPNSTARAIAKALMDHLEMAVHAGQRFEDLDLFGGIVVVGAKELSDSALLTRVSDMKRALSQLF